MPDVLVGEWKWRTRCSCGAVLERIFRNDDPPRVECVDCGREWEIVAGTAVCKRGPFSER
jgi:hypothetical protein